MALDSRHPPPRIIRIKYRSGVNGRVAVAFCKVPYSGLFDLSEKMARLLHMQQIRWFRIEPASAQEIAANRSTLARWSQALAETVGVTKINLEV